MKQIINWYTSNPDQHEIGQVYTIGKTDYIVLAKEQKRITLRKAEWWESVWHRFSEWWHEVMD